jgi:hypothetical protein
MKEWAPIAERPEQTYKGIPTPSGYSPVVFAWTVPYFFETPKGYSAMIVHPLNRNDLPFITSEGVADSDKILIGGHLPFWIRNDFEGIIPAGTPYAQIIPLKRDSWRLTFDKTLAKRGRVVQHKLETFFIGFYKLKMWEKKDYK